jgi:hypothetical protein
MLGPGFEIQLRNAIQERNREIDRISLMKSTVLQQRRLERNARIRLKLASAMIAMGNRIHGTTEPSGAQAEPASP